MLVLPISVKLDTFRYNRATVWEVAHRAIPKTPSSLDGGWCNQTHQGGITYQVLLNVTRTKHLGSMTALKAPINGGRPTRPLSPSPHRGEHADRSSTGPWNCWHEMVSRPQSTASVRRQPIHMTHERTSNRPQNNYLGRKAAAQAFSTPFTCLSRRKWTALYSQWQSKNNESRKY